MGPTLVTPYTMLMAEVMLGGAVLIWVGAGLCVYGAWICRITEMVSVRPMTQSRRFGFVAFGALALGAAGLMFGFCYHGQAAEFATALSFIQSRPQLGTVMWLTIYALLGAAPIVIISVGWIYAFPSALSHRAGHGYVLIEVARGLAGSERLSPVVFPERSNGRWDYYNLP